MSIKATGRYLFWLAFSALALVFMGIVIAGQSLAAEPMARTQSASILASSFKVAPGAPRVPLATNTNTVTNTPTRTNTPTITNTPTRTNTPTITNTFTRTNPPTITSTPCLTDYTVTQAANATLVPGTTLL